MGFGFIFLGLDYLTQIMKVSTELLDFSVISAVSHYGFLSTLLGAAAGMVITLLIHSSAASIAIILVMAYNGVIGLEMAASMILGANIGTTIDAALAAIGVKTAAKRAALVHILFNVIGTIWALLLLKLLLALVNFITPGIPAAGDPAITTHLAMLHTVFNSINTIIFLPFVNQFSALVSFMIKESKQEESGHYRFVYVYSAVTASSPELNILRAEKEIRDMAGVVSSMYTRFSNFLNSLYKTEDKEKAVSEFCEEIKNQENYTDEMRESLTVFLIECTREQLNPQTERRVTLLLRVIGDIEEMSDECYGISRLLERSVRKKRIFKKDEMDELVLYVDQVEKFLDIFRQQLGYSPVAMLAADIVPMQNEIAKSRKKLQKLSRKRIEAGKDVKTELLFIDLVNRIEKLGDYCSGLTEKILN